MELCYYYTELKCGCLVTQTLIPRETGRMVGKQSIQMCSKSIQPRHQLKNLKPLSQWEFCHLLLSERTKANTHSKRIPIRQTNISSLSTPVFLLTSVFEAKLSHIHLTLHICKICVRKKLLPSCNFYPVFPVILMP